MLRKLPFVFCILSIFACNSEDFDEVSISKENKGIVNSEHLVSIEDGRLSFSSVENFNDFYSSLRDESPNKVADLFKKDFYSHDFLSFAPAIKDENDPIVEKHLNNLNTKITFSQSSLSKNLLSEDDLDDLEDVLGDENLTYILNSDGEVKVGDKIYKFTDAGLFISDEQSLGKVNQILHENNIPTTLSIQPDEENSLKFLEKYNPEGGNVNIDEGVSHYVTTARKKIKRGKGMNSNVHLVGHSTNNDEYFKIAESLPSSTGHRPFVGNLFGNVIVTHDQYQRRRRVKIKYYDVDVSLGYAIGIKVKHQKRGWTRLWSRTNADEIALGISSITWKFDRYEPFRQFQGAKEVFLKKQNLTYNAYTHFLSEPYSPPNIPSFFDRHVVDVLVNQYIPSEFMSEAQAQKLIYKSTFDGIKAAFQSIHNRHNQNPQDPTYNPENIKYPTNVLCCTATPSAVRFSFFKVKAKDNADKVEHIFDLGGATPQITYDLEFGNFNLGSFSYDFKKPDLVNITGFGMAKAGGAWHGRRIDFTSK